MQGKDSMFLSRWQYLILLKFRKYFCSSLSAEIFTDKMDDRYTRGLPLHHPLPKSGEGLKETILERFCHFDGVPTILRTRGRQGGPWQKQTLDKSSFQKWDGASKETKHRVSCWRILAQQSSHWQQQAQMRVNKTENIHCPFTFIAH